MMRKLEKSRRAMFERTSRRDGTKGGRYRVLVVKGGQGGITSTG